MEMLFRLFMVAMLLAPTTLSVGCGGPSGVSSDNAPAEDVDVEEPDANPPAEE